MPHHVRSLFRFGEVGKLHWQRDNDFSFDVGGVILSALHVHDAEQRGGDRQQLVCLHSSDRFWTQVGSGSNLESGREQADRGWINGMTAAGIENQSTQT